ncbi:H-type small acid-soluble spore protein [Paenibacillus sp. MMO-177]|uniref:H-type small acid-soluble spore protein n=1 Tax=Paenibacillus sp. MMO-177 TaxID=3081289 RepID=UPI003FA75E55
MDINRAKEIAASPVMEDVKYNGKQIYIQHVDDANETARIYPLTDPEQELEVPVRSLVEQSSTMGMEVDEVACRASLDGN